MGDTNEIPPGVLKEFDVADPKFIIKTNIARIWKVRSQQGLAALKIYHKPNMGNEAGGFRFIKSLHGKSAARVFQTGQNIALSEWLDGPSLGDLTRENNDQEASLHLVNVANSIHSQTRNLGLILPSLETWFSALFALKFAPDCPTKAQQNIVLCQKLASHLLSSQTDIRPLHGDLHHDNIRHGKRGYCAFDAKGISGERAYELANAFRNPKGAAAVVASPARLRFVLKTWAQAFNVDQKRLLQWACVKIALSISWRCDKLLHDDAELELLGIFLDELNAYESLC